MPGALELVAPSLACPVCRAALAPAPSGLRCPAGHSFDVARQGYVSLLGGGERGTTGDTAAMVIARERFLGRGHYAPLAAAVSDAVPDGATGLCLDLAGGTGYHLRRVVEDHPGLVGLDLDLSPAALRRAAQTHERVAAASADVWQRLPVRTGAAAVVLSVFGPRNGEEIARVLDPERGVLVVATPTAEHLRELVGPLGLLGVDPHKQDRLDAQLAGLDRLAATPVTYRVRMSHADVLDVVLMGPSAHHVDAAALAERVAALPEPVAVTVAVTVSRYGASAAQKPVGVGRG